MSFDLLINIFFEQIQKTSINELILLKKYSISINSVNVLFCDKKF